MSDPKSPKSIMSNPDFNTIGEVDELLGYGDGFIPSSREDLLASKKVKYQRYLGPRAKIRALLTRHENKQRRKGLVMA